MQGVRNVLFLCTGNSARSIMAEGILNSKGKPSFHAYSAGSHPPGAVPPEGLWQLERALISTSGLRSKGWDEFAGEDAPKLDFILTVCDNAAKEVCPVWPGHPVTAHWGISDPAAVRGTEERVEEAYREAFGRLERRIGLFLGLPFTSLDSLSLNREVEKIGHK